MTVEEARAWIDSRFGGTAVDLMAALVGLVTKEGKHQNLIAASTAPHIWVRHVVDSAQLIPLADTHQGSWLDIGSGAGFPGLVVAALTSRRVDLVEPRLRRAAFLRYASDVLGIAGRVAVYAAKVEKVKVRANVISARAVASLDSLFNAASHCAETNTIWVLPKGRAATEEIAIARRQWHAVFHVERSMTDHNSSIVVASRVSRR